MLKPTTGYVIIAELQTEPAAFDAFVKGMELNASRSLAAEPGLHHFEVLVDRPNCKVTLVEGYENREAFDSHTRTAHFQEWKQAHFASITARSSRHLQAVAV